MQFFKLSFVWSSLLFALPGALYAQQFGKDILQCAIELPNGTVYWRGATDPVPDLVVSMRLTNTTQREDRTPKEIRYADADWITEDELEKMKTMDDDARKALLASKMQIKTVKETPVNKNSIGIAYVEPELGPHDLVAFEIYRLPSEGEDENAPEFKKPIERDMRVLHTHRQDLQPNKYLAAGEEREGILLPVGRYYNIQKPGMYSIKAIYAQYGNSQNESKVVESETLQFQVLPYKIVPNKIDDLIPEWENFERGYPGFDYMFYQLQRSAPFQEIYYVRKLRINHKDKWEWHRLCTVAPNTKVQVAQVNPHTVAILAHQTSGKAGQYTIDFTTDDPTVTTKLHEIKNDTMPTLRVEGGQVTIE